MVFPVICLEASSQLAAGLPLFLFPSTIPWMMVLLQALVSGDMAKVGELSRRFIPKNENKEGNKSSHTVLFLRPFRVPGKCIHSNQKCTQRHVSNRIQIAVSILIFAILFHPTETSIPPAHLMVCP